MSDHPAESSHWYDINGKPQYTRLTKDGRTRNTTLRDAKKEGLLPSVTTIISSLAKPGLDRWKQEQVLLAALTLPRFDGELEADWLTRVMQDSRATGKEAMERGTQMHSMLEAYFEQVPLPTIPNYCINTELALRMEFGDQFWECEKSFAHPLGYAGKCDAFSTEGFVIDFKTKESLENVTVYLEHILQLAAYREGLNMPNARCAIVFVSPNLSTVCEIEEEDLRDGWEMFQCLLSFFQIKNKL